MAAALESVSKSPILSSALKSLFFAITVFFLRAGGQGFFSAAVFSSLFILFYFRPAIGSVKFLASASAVVLLTLKLPYSPAYEIYLSVFLGTLFYLLLGVKNLIHARRLHLYYLLHFGEVTGLSALAIKGIIHPFPAFLIFFFLFREFYLFSLNNVSSPKIWLAGGIEALTLNQALFVVSFLPLGSLLGGALASTLVFVFHDLILRHSLGSLSREIILRNATSAIFLTLLIFGTSTWTLS
ncbi:MAG: hypothetical protein HYW37_02440 [Candidatus Colwellbacteria bacterium]|nr:hypothetical protein [Candidatus Colwellbacteria bacterium]